MLKKFNLFMTIFIITIVITGCSSNEEPSKINVEFLNNKTVMSTEGFQTYMVKLTDREGNLVEAENVYIYMNMKMMNHPIEGTMQQTSPGLYELDLPLAMAGDWYVHISVTWNGERILFEDFSITAQGEKNLEYIKGYHADQQ